MGSHKTFKKLNVVMKLLHGPVLSCKPSAEGGVGGNEDRDAWGLSHRDLPRQTRPVQAGLKCCQLIIAKRVIYARVLMCTCVQKRCAHVPYQRAVSGCFNWSDSCNVIRKSCCEPRV